MKKRYNIHSARAFVKNLDGKIDKRFVFLSSNSFEGYRWRRDVKITWFWKDVITFIQQGLWWKIWTVGLIRDLFFKFELIWRIQMTSWHWDHLVLKKRYNIHSARAVVKNLDSRIDKRRQLSADWFEGYSSPHC